MPPVRRIVLPLAAVLILGLAAVVVILVVAGDRDELSAEQEAYVGEVCQALGSFAQNAQPIVDELGSPSTEVNDIAAGADQLADALARLHRDLQDISPPSAVAPEHEQTVSATEGLGSSFAQLADALRRGDAARLDEIGNSAQDLSALFPRGEDYPAKFASAFRDHPACQQAKGFFEGEAGAQADRYAPARAAEADASPDLPGQFVDLAAIYGGPYRPGSPNTNAHRLQFIDYASEQGLPPVGGPHWGAVACASTPADSPMFCGPVPWGVYPPDLVWHAESLVHSMEHAGVVVWYNTEGQLIIDQLLDWGRSNAGRHLVVAPYPDLTPETIGITAWSRRDVFPAGPLDTGRLQRFLDAHECRFDPERLCAQA